MKRVFILISLFSLMICSCNSATTPSSSTSEETRIYEPYDMEKDYIVEGYDSFNLIGLKNDFCFFKMFSNIPKILEDMKYDEEHKVYVPDLYTIRIYSTIYDEYYQKIPGTITFTENGYFASAGEDRDDANYNFYRGIVYNYVCCNQEVELLPNKVSFYDFMNEIDYTIYLKFERKDYGHVTYAQYCFEKDGNQYVVGSKLLNRNINTNSKAVQYVNQHSTFEIPLGCLIDNVNVLEHEENYYRFCGLPLNNFSYRFSSFIIGYYVTEMPESHYQNSECVARGGELTVSSINLNCDNNSDNICGVKSTMSIEEAKDILLKQGFKYQEFEIKNSFTKEQIVKTHAFSMDNVMIEISKSLNHPEFIDVYVYIDLNS